MKGHEKALFFVAILMIVGIIGLNYYVGEFYVSDDSGQVLQKRSGSLLTGAAIGVQEEVQLSSGLILAEWKNCPQYTSEGQSVCGAANCSWKTDSYHGGDFCGDFFCIDADGTNDTYCTTTLNQSYGVECEWNASLSLCDPLGGEFFGNGCDDFTTQTDCSSAGPCSWNSTGSNCGFADDFFFGSNPSCGFFNSDSATCGNISGCTTGATTCNGHENDGGISCSDLNQSLCSGATFLSTCCNWDGNACEVSYDPSCYNSVSALPIGGTYCEDFLAFTNQTLCQQIAGAPWYMPCEFNSSGKGECHFNGAAFGSGDFSSFDECPTEMGCEAQGGVWKSETWANNGDTYTDTWCEFNFGSGGNCDSSCWACENDAGVTNLATAESVCEGSGLGYCEFFSDSNALNGYGWCGPKNDFIDGGGKDCNDECGACDFLNSPQQECGNSIKGCTWEADTGAPNNAGYCYGQNEKRCSTDCYSCYNSTECVANGKGQAGACTWDDNSYYCKEVGESGEICFDGADNDNDNKIDCEDSGCATDKFCGGEDLSTNFGNCPTNQDNATCVTAGCVWLEDSFGGGFGGDFNSSESGFCDFPGSQCFQHDSDNTSCDATDGCTYLTQAGGICEMNETTFEGCFSASNESSCTAIGGCGWNSGGIFGGGFGGESGWCEPVIFSQCFGNTTRQLNQAACETNVTINSLSTQICAWSTDFMGTGCKPICFTKSGAECSAGTNGLCEVVSGICEPDAFGGKCFEADGNQSWCDGTLNSTCTFSVDVLGNNNVSPGNTSGWCNPEGNVGFINFYGEQEPVVLGTDENESAVDDSYDINTISLKDDFDKFGFGTSLYDEFVNSGTCSGTPLQSGGIGSGLLNYTFFWYLDTNGMTTGGCAARDNSSEVGYEFSFKYTVTRSGATLTEVPVAYQCVGSNWGAVPIPLTTAKQIMCDNIGGGMIGIDKQEMFKFKNLFNKSADLRLYASVSNNTQNNTYVVDTAGPFYYSQGSFDFKFEDCSNPSADSDGDGLVASNDPDCMDFLKFGFVPNEIGFQCTDGIDNDADGMTDCDDSGCLFSFECGGTGQATVDANDKTAPKIIWLQPKTFPDSAFIMYDTNEPANGTIEFYRDDSSCVTLNKSIRDVGLIDDFIPSYKMWHDGPIDNSAYNPEYLGFALTNASTYYFKAKVCDVNGNCAVSACTNFTTKASFASCNGCSSTFNFPFTPLAGDAVTDPLGNLQFNFELPDGSTSNLQSDATSGKQFNYSQTKGFNLEISNPNSTNGSNNWKIKLINASVVGKVSSSVGNMTGGISFNSTTDGAFVGLGNTKCQELINTFRPKKLEIGIPGNNSELWQCGASLTNCTDKTSNATLIDYNITTNLTTWQVPAEWGC
jgi:hypothetical protein